MNMLEAFLWEIRVDMEGRITWSTKYWVRKKTLRWLLLTRLLSKIPNPHDLIATVQYETDCDKLIVYKPCVADDFFVLSTGVAGEILQKFINYHKKIAIVGDYSEYTSKPLKDFIYESNKGNSIYFVSSIEEALLKLESAE